MKTKAAVVMKQPGKWEVIEADVDEPKEFEVLVRMKASGLCHSDDHIAKGVGLVDHFPYCAGHEGAGIVEMIGPGVTSVAVGDHVLTAFIPACGRCRWCASGMQNLCDNGALLTSGAMFDGTYRLHYQGQGVAKLSMLGTFAELSVIPEISVIKIPSHIPFTSACILGCGVPTGWGSAVNAAAVGPGDVVIVVGIGGVGMSAVQGAAHAGAGRVIVADPVSFKRQQSLALGATDAFATLAEAAEFGRSLTNGQGADSVILTIGVLSGQDVADGFEAIRKAGTVVVTGVAPQAHQGIPINPFMLTMYQKRIQGALFGMMSPSRDTPRLIEMYERGVLKLDEMVTRTYTLDEINLGYEDMHSGANIRGVIKF